MTELQVAIGAAAISLFALVWTVVFNFQQQSEIRRIANLSESISVEAKLGELPSALRFHGITDEQLETAGITAAEFAYLVNSFTVGRLYYLAERIDKRYRNKNRLFQAGSYRHTMCLSEHTRKAWPLVRLMLADSNYRRAIDAMIRDIEAQGVES